MPTLKLPAINLPNDLALRFSDDGRLIDFLTDSLLGDRPEERVRQSYLRILHYQYGYSKPVLAREVPIYSGSSQLRDHQGNPLFADIVVYEAADACRDRDQGRIRFVVENKAPNEESGHNQLVSYIFNTSSNGAVWYNGEQAKWYRRYSTPEQKLVPWPGVPGPGMAWDAVGRRTKAQLLALVDVRATLERCHNKLYRRGSEGDDLTMDMVRLLLAKARDEERDGDDPLFYCTPEEYESEVARGGVAERIQSLFTEVRDANPTVFEDTERIRVGNRQIVEVVVELQDYRLIGDDDTQWDVMGAAYEQYTAEVLKREGGEFFTNRLVVALLVKIVDPQPDEIVLDPAGGTGGFATAAIRHMRGVVRRSDQATAVKRRRIELLKDRIFLIDIKHRLVKIAKCAMILSGNGHRGYQQGDSLAPFDRLPTSFLERAQPGLVDRLFTNPPFAGTTTGKIDQPTEMVPQFELARKWAVVHNRYRATNLPLPGGVPPELLFIERCLQWLKPGGVLGIVVPKGVLENPDVTLAARHHIFHNSFVRAVITLHKNTFQPYTGSRTALLVLQKKQLKELGKPEVDYSIFMAMSRKPGQDSEGVPIFVKDANGRPTDKLDHDLDAIFEAWLAHRDGTLIPSEYAFAVMRSEIDPRILNISPQAYLPSLNEAIATVLTLGESDAFEVSTVGKLASRVYKGTRFKREDLDAEATSGANVVRYYTPAALLQDQAESVKYLDLGKASARRRREIERHKLGRLDLLVTRSGTVGRVLLTTSEHAGQVGSDDLIHVDIEDVNLRAYVYEFLKSDLGQKQMKKNEYGTIQQHLEPHQLKEVLVPIPTDPERLQEIAQQILRAVEQKEISVTMERGALSSIQSLIQNAGQSDKDVR
jgi:type I restriction enzyme M protein